MYLIAEIGFNHGGDMILAGDMIQAAAQAGADAVKFQTFRAQDIALPSSPHYAMIQKGELSLKDHMKLSEIAQKYSIDFLSTPFSTEGVDLLMKVGVSAFKVASMDCTNHPLLRYIAKTGKSIYLSTGMARLEEIADSLDELAQNNCTEVAVLHCISKYPAAAEDLNLDIISYLKEKFKVRVGYSDHYPGIEACFAAAIQGAEIIETHFTLDKTLPDGDHSHSADPADLIDLKTRFTLFSTMTGSRKIIDQRPDQGFAKDFRRGVYTRRAVKKGERLTETNLYCTRPPNDFTPDDIKYLNGKILNQDLAANSPVSPLTIDDL